MVEVVDESGNPNSCRISVAFGLEKNQDTEQPVKPGKHNSRAQWKIKSLAPGQVFIYFPAGKETSNLLFHIHAPFASTVARDSVRDCPENNVLRDHLANLIAESMTIIREQELLSVGFLATLPNNRDNLRPFYKPILTTLIEAFQNEKLTPMKQGGHAAATGIFTGSGQLSNLISDDDLVTILGVDFFPPMWVANPPQKNQREDNFLSMLEIPEWKIENLVEVLSIPSESILKWLNGKKDEWHQQLYMVLGGFFLNAPSYPPYKSKFEALRIVRLSDGTYSIGNMCYFPRDDGVEHDDLMPRVAKGVYTSGQSELQQKKAKEFLELIGVREVGEAEQVEEILKKRYSLTAIYLKTFKPNMEDIKRFIALVQKEQSSITLFKDCYIFELAIGKWGKPDQVYLDSPFSDTGLASYFEALKEKSPCWALSQKYIDFGIKLEICDFAQKVGAILELPITDADYEQNPEYNNFFSGSDGRNRSSYEYYTDYEVKNLAILFETPTIELSRLVWRTMNSADTMYLTAKFRKSYKGGFSHFPSQLVLLLRNAAWIPQKSDKFVRPCNASRDQLPNGFPYDDGQKWISAIEFGTATQKQSEEIINRNQQAKIMGFDSDNECMKWAHVASISRQQGKTLDDVISLLNPSKKKEISFPSKPVSDPERRKEKIAEKIADAPEKEYAKREKSTRTTGSSIDKKTSLRNQYTNEFGQMVCQICKKEMPFKDRNNDYYFEAIAPLSRNYLNKELEAQHLALCPLCAAMYTVFVINDEDAMVKLKQELVIADDCDVPLMLGKLETSIRFVETHLFDLKEILGGSE